MKKISIVVPMYNSFHMMKRNLDVLTKQTKAEIELIIVDDCSTDDSLSAANEYASRSSFDVIVIQNEKNGGPGVCRNIGIAHATGDYVTFVDSDDYFSDNYTEILAPLLETDVDCVIYDYCTVDENGNHLATGKSIENSAVVQGYVDARIALTYTAGSTMCKIYRREALLRSGAQFGEYFRNEDMPFTKHAIALSESVYYCAEYLYHYVQMSTSLMHNTKLLDERNCQRSFSILAERLSGRDLDRELLAIELREVLNTTVLIKIQKKESRASIRQYIRSHYSKAHIRNPYFANLPKHVKIISYCAYYKSILALTLILKYKEHKQKKSK